MHSWTREYLTILGLKEETPSRKYLTKIIRSHVRTFPFENISKLLFTTQQNPTSIISVDMFLENHIKYDTGGTCFTLNSCLFRLLLSLGFEGYLIRPGEEHLAVIIHDPEEKSKLLYVDVGTTAPIFYPIPFEGKKRSIPSFAGEKVLFLPHDKEGEYTYIRVKDKKIIDKKWTFSVFEQMELEDFQPWVQRTYEKNALFMNILRCQLWQPGKRRGLSLVNRKFTIRTGSGGVLTRILTDRHALQHILEEEFKMPKLPVWKALDKLESKGIHIF